MNYATIISIIPTLLNTIKSVIDIYNSNPKNIQKKLKGTGFNNKIFSIDEMLTKLHYFKQTLLFYSNFLPETASVYTLSDKLNEMIQGSLKDLRDSNSPNYDSTWQVITMMFNSVKQHKNSQIVSRTDLCPYSSDSEEIKKINKLLRELENEFEKANAYLTSRNASHLLEQTSRIAQLTSDLKTLILQHTVSLIESITIEAR